jgi:hypothetical protein
MGLASPSLPQRVRCFGIFYLSLCGRLEQALDLRVEIRGDREGRMPP